jgi:outer membrane protein TolC
VLRAQVEAQKMANMALTLEQEKDTTRVEINLLIGKNADEALGEPAELKPVFVTQSWEEIQKAALAGSPEIGKSKAMVGNRRALKRSADLEYLPDFNVGYRRKTMNDVWSGSDLMVGISVPLWFWSQNAGVKLASAELKAAEAEQRNMALMTAAKAKESYTKLAAGRRLIELYDVSVLPRSEQSLKVAQSAFAAGRMGFLELLDSVRAYIDFRTEYYNYVADYLKNTAVLERTVGAALTDGGNK